MLRVHSCPLASWIGLYFWTLINQSLIHPLYSNIYNIKWKFELRTLINWQKRKGINNSQLHCSAKFHFFLCSKIKIYKCGSIFNAEFNAASRFSEHIRIFLNFMLKFRKTWKKKPKLHNSVYWKVTGNLINNCFFNAVVLSDTYTNNFPANRFRNKLFSDLRNSHVSNCYNTIILT